LIFSSNSLLLSMLSLYYLLGFEYSASEFSSSSVTS